MALCVYSSMVLLRVALDPDLLLPAWLLAAATKVRASSGCCLPAHNLSFGCIGCILMAASTASQCLMSEWLPQAKIGEHSSANSAGVAYDTLTW